MPSGPSRPPGPASTCCARSRSPSTSAGGDCHRCGAGVRRLPDGSFHVPRASADGDAAGHPEIRRDRGGPRAVGQLRLPPGHQLGGCRVTDAELGGGSILDVGCYAVSVARLVDGVALGDQAAEPDQVVGCANRPAGSCRPHRDGCAVVPRRPARADRLERDNEARRRNPRLRQQWPGSRAAAIMAGGAPGGWHLGHRSRNRRGYPRGRGGPSRGSSATRPIT